MDNRKRKRSRGGDNRKPQQQNASSQVRKHMAFDDLDVPQVNEPRPVCSICGQNIDFIAEAISESDGSFSHFDCVLEKLRKEYQVKEDETLSYVGHGNFAVFAKDAEGKLTIKTRIPYESKDSYDGAKRFVEGSKQ
ncbi:MAG: hypothetical protein IKP61_03500 [Spirochaetales bacterium]|nr:hypothetical protein [Spirochaetales bacterium]